MRPLTILLAFALFCFAVTAEAARCPGGKCPVPNVLTVPVTAEVAQAAVQPVRGVVKAVAQRRPVRSIMARFTDRRPGRRIAGVIRKLPRLRGCR